MYSRLFFYLAKAIKSGPSIQKGKVGSPILIILINHDRLLLSQIVGIIFLFSQKVSYNDWDNYIKLKRG